MKKEGSKIIISLFLYIIAIILPYISNNLNVVSKIIFVLSYLNVGLSILKKALRNILRGKAFDENFLMAVATIGAFAIGEFPEAVAVMLFYQVGELFQSYAVDKSRKSISTLMDIRPDYANLKIENEIKKVDPSEVKIGDIIVVKPGEKIPLDGIVVKGVSMLDTKALTGETVPRKASLNEEVLSGCINQDGVLEIKVTKEYGESTVSKILELVENASNNKSKSENFITKFALVYTPIVVIIAVILAVPPLILKADFIIWLHRALSFLVVSCPCALVISIPLSFLVVLEELQNVGILIKGSNYLENLASTQIAVFDKTGTLTKGVFAVQKIENVNIEKDELIKLCSYSENYSNHPIAKSIKEYYGKEIDESKISDVNEISGYGIRAIVEGKEVLIGNEKLMKEFSISYNECKEVGTVLYVAVDKKYAGFILIADEIKEDSKRAISLLKSFGVKKTVMLTGDRSEVAEEVSKKLDIDAVYSELLPDGKVEKVNELLKQKTEKGKLIFVGDGINDSPVLALADTGIAMGGVGSDSAVEASDIVIMTDEPSKICDGIEISKKTMKIVRENIVFAISVKVLVLILSAFGLSNMWQAVFADVGVSVIAILNALRMLKVKNKI